MIPKYIRNAASSGMKFPPTVGLAALANNSGSAITALISIGSLNIIGVISSSKNISSMLRNMLPVSSVVSPVITPPIRSLVLI